MRNHRGSVLIWLVCLIAVTNCRPLDDDPEVVRESVIVEAGSRGYDVTGARGRFTGARGYGVTVARGYDETGARGHDVTGTHGDDIFELRNTSILRHLGIGQPTEPVFPRYASYDARLKSFESWPIAMPITKESLAEAGLVYTREGDRTFCYYCSRGLERWEPTDVPWEEHAKHSSSCHFVFMNKGQAYIDNVRGQPTTLPSNEEIRRLNLPSCIRTVEPNATEEAENERGEEKSSVAGPSAENKSTERASDEEPKELDDARTCKVCYSEELGIVFLPCKHLMACVKCAARMTDCGICREKIRFTVSAILP